MINLGEKGIVKILPVLFIVAIVGLISFLLISSTAGFKNSLFGSLYPKPKSHAAGSCTAGDIVELSKCMQQAKAGQVSSVEITNLIDCSVGIQNGPNNGPFNGSGSGQVGCNYNLDNVTTPITISGKSGTLAGFRRSNSYNYNIFHLGNSQNITISNLIFDDGTNPCPGTPSEQYCNTPIRVENGNNLTFDHLLIENIKAMGMEVTPSTNIIVTNSIFYHIGQGSGKTYNGYSGIWFGQDSIIETKGGSGYTLRNNLFKDLEGPGFFFGALDGSNNAVDGNFFDHTHILKDFGPVCPNSCGGGQLVMNYINSGLTITNNVVINGRKDADPTNTCCTTSGVEIDGGAHNVTISGNDFHNNSGEAVGVEYQRSYSNIVISNNKVYNNSLISHFPDYNMFGNATLSNNCSTPTCMMVTKSYIFSSVNPCIIPLGQTSCPSKIIWVTNDFANVNVLIGQSVPVVYNTGPSGNGDSLNVDDRGATYILSSNGNTLGSVVLSALRPYFSLTASPNPCIIPAGQSLCDSKISWYTAFVPGQIGVKVDANSSYYAPPNQPNNIDGDAPWIGTGGNTFHLYSDNTELTSLSVSGVPAATPTPTPTAAPLPTPTPPIASIPPGGTTVNFDSLPQGALNGQYPSGLIDWTYNRWMVNGPNALLTQNSVSYNSASTGATFFYLLTGHIASLQVANLDSSQATVGIGCNQGNPNVFQLVPANSVVTINTNWTHSCGNNAIQIGVGAATWNVKVNNILIMPSSPPAPVIYNIFTNQVPNLSTDTNSYELGVKFRSTVGGGSVTGVRFYKGANNTGTHTGSLWTSSGANLATATFGSETVSGWQQVNFPTPVTIAPNTTFVASYHTNTGAYAQDVNGFASSGVTNGPLIALQNGLDGGNGVFASGTSTSFPNSTWNASNYFVDVVFSQSSSPTTSPTATPTPAPTIAPTATPNPTLSPTSAPTSAGSTTITFDDLTYQDLPLNGQYPTDVIDWGNGAWFLSSPYGQFRTKSVSFSGPGITTAVFNLISPRVVSQITAYNGGTTNSTVSLACTAHPTVQLSVGVNQIVTIATNWSTPCSSVTIGSSNGWDTNFDNLIIQ